MQYLNKHARLLFPFNLQIQKKLYRTTRMFGKKAIHCYFYQKETSAANCAFRDRK